MYVHHVRCPIALAWDIPNVPCECPRGWPKDEQELSQRLTPFSMERETRSRAAAGTARPVPPSPHTITHVDLLAVLRRQGEREDEHAQERAISKQLIRGGQ